MNFDKLYVGMVIKNYKELCMLLEIEVLTSNSKKAQLKEIERYVLLEKIGHKFIVKEIYKDIKPKIENRGGANNNIDYIKHIEVLILDMLFNDYNLKKGEIFLSKNKLLLGLQMININYAYCKDRIPKLSTHLNIKKILIEEFYNKTEGMLIGNIEKALNNLRMKSLAMWSKETAICKINSGLKLNEIEEDVKINKNTFIDQYGEEVVKYNISENIDTEYRQATTEEKQEILCTEIEVCEAMGYENRKAIFEAGKEEWKKYQTKVNSILFDKLNISFYFESYKIICNEEHIIKEYEDVFELELTYDKRNFEGKMLNDSIKQRIKDNAEKRQVKASKDKKMYSIGKPYKFDYKENVLSMRLSKEYLNNFDILLLNLIDLKADNIKDKVKKSRPNTFYPELYEMHELINYNSKGSDFELIEDEEEDNNIDIWIDSLFNEIE